MRISDWSSDVCSSDLPEAGVDDTLPATAATEVQAAPTQAELDYAAIYGEPPYDPVYDDTLPAPAQMPQSYDPDRTSVVSGRRGSVRVDLGGRGIIKKKKKEKKHEASSKQQPHN